MKTSVIEYVEEGHRCAVLVDQDAVFTAPDRDDGKIRMHYPGAIDLGRCKGGVLHIDPANGRLLYPRPCVYVKTADAAENSLLWIRTHLKSATTMLDLSKAATNVGVDFAGGDWQFKGPREKGLEINWGDWRWVSAWRWNWWNQPKAKGNNGTKFYHEMVQFGYPDSAPAFRKMLSRMGLVTSRGS